jgi:hypothetical protein
MEHSVLVCLGKPIMPGAQLTADQHEWQTYRPMSTFAHKWLESNASDSPHASFLDPLSTLHSMIDPAATCLRCRMRNPMCRD